MLAEMSSDAIRRSEGTDHSRLSVILRYTASGSDEFNDMQLYLLPIVDLDDAAGFPFEPGDPADVARCSRGSSVRARAAGSPCAAPILTISRISNSTISPIPRTCAA